MEHRKHGAPDGIAESCPLWRTEGALPTRDGRTRWCKCGISRPFGRRESEGRPSFSLPRGLIYPRVERNAMVRHSYGVPEVGCKCKRPPTRSRNVLLILDPRQALTAKPCRGRAWRSTDRSPPHPANKHQPTRLAASRRRNLLFFKTTRGLHPVFRLFGDTLHLSSLVWWLLGRQTATRKDM